MPVDRHLYIGGITILGVSVILIYEAMFTLLAASALAPELAIVGTGVLLPGALVLAAAAVLMAMAGTGGILAAVAPPVFDYTRRVAPCELRLISLSNDTPKPLVSMLNHLCELERLSNGEIDILDRARAAAAKDDAKYYDAHLRDLFVVQSRKNHFAKAAADDMRNFLKDNGEILKRIDTRVDLNVPIRDAINPISELRHELINMGISASEINSLLYFSRVPSEQLSYVVKSVKQTLKGTDGDLARTLFQLADDLESIEWLSKDAFYE